MRKLERWLKAEECKRNYDDVKEKKTYCRVQKSKEEEWKNNE